METLSKKCNFKPRNALEAEVGCPLDHCSCGTHNVKHQCAEHSSDFETDIRAAELAAGWDPNP